MNPVPKPVPDTSDTTVVGACREKQGGIFAAVKESVLYGGFSPWFGKIEDLQPLPDRPWNISKQRATVTGSFWFSLRSEKHKGDILVHWEQYRNGEYVPQVMDDGGGFEIVNRTPPILPPDIEIGPGTYAWRAGTFRGIILTIGEGTLTLDYVDRHGFIIWEQRSRFQMVGKRLHLIGLESRSRERVFHGYTFAPWKKMPEWSMRIKKNSDTEFEIIRNSHRLRFVRETKGPLKGWRGYAYMDGERIKGFRVARLKARKNQDQDDS